MQVRVLHKSNTWWWLRSPFCPNIFFYNSVATVALFSQLLFRIHVDKITCSVGMLIQVRVSGHPWFFNLTGVGVGVILYLWVHSHPTRTE
jgi:hypothetical protein